MTAVGGGVMTWRNCRARRRSTPIPSRTFGLVVGIEVALAAIGAAVLARRRSSELIPAWVALVVGVHLFPVALLVRSPLIAVTAVLVTLAAVPLARSPPGGGERRHRTRRRDRAPRGGAVVAGQRPPLAVTSGVGVLDTLEHMFEHRAHGGHWRWS